MKKIISVFLLFVILFGFSACTEDARPDMTALSERLASINEYYAFDYFDAVVYDGAYHIYFSLCSENDVMLSVHADNEGNIDDVTVIAAAEKMKTDGERKAYMNFSSAVIESFADLSEKEKKEKEKSLSYKKPGLYFSDLYETYSALRYNFVFSSNSEFISLYCEYTEIMEVTGKQ